MKFGTWGAVLAGMLLPVLSGCERTQVEQRGYRGTAQIQVHKPKAVADLSELNRIPPPEDPADVDSPPAGEVFVNVKVLNDISATEFSRLMQAFSTWVSPVEGCDFCHNPDNLESDEKYPKIVARRMIEMTRRINSDWQKHVGETGVTCWTCHRGEAVPSGDWFVGAGPLAGMSTFAGNRAGQNAPSPTVGNAALPNDPLTRFLVNGDDDIRVQSTTALRTREHPPSIKSAERSYGLMMYMAGSLGVNCTYCHNTRTLGNWDQSTPQRATAWHGIRMVRELNTEFLIPLESTFPPNRLGPHGDGPKIGCATCHKGTFKPLNGVSPLRDYEALSGVGKVPAGVPSEPDPAPETAKAEGAAANAPRR